ncbi:XrtA-associated tyrosine autokinase [Kordiimonas marina]|uniref:XrtA-associated tyrosine autokinase n=1 Tax=Kordiimonas marina TaxID=2872312 RepID=UPI001FF2DA7E|nr:XrtA-associated tyrosine autokinase [Kordiimonas marina]MCJ9430367.1 XrtA-associated tyrosine autokinase [Kordiimonas marina]
MDLIERAAMKAKQKEKEARSLVERAAEKAASGAKPVGGIGTPKPAGDAPRSDPSSLNPGAGADSGVGGKTAPRGIGDPTAPRQPRPAPKEQDEAIVGFEAKTGTLAIGEPGAIAATEQPGPVAAKRPKGGGKPRREEEIDLVALRDAGYITPDMPPNLMSEEFRIIKRSLLLTAFAKGDKKTKNSNIVLVTSSNPGEGKTFCTINLALSIATEQDVTVLLVDADFSKPEVLNRLGVAGGRGLMDVVADSELDLGDCLVRTNIPNLVLLPAGRQHNLTTELLASERMEHIVNELSTRYPDRIVIFDSPPVLASSAASVLALYMGQTVFVIEAEKTTEPQIKESLTMISSCENINLILNKTRYSGSNKKFASYYGYGGR